VVAVAGSIYIIYDHERYKAKEILMARVTQEDILAGQLITPSSVLRIVLNRAAGEAKR